MMVKNIRESGFTLLEMLIVLTIMGILTAIATPVYLEKTTNAKLIEVTNAMSYIASALAIFHEEAIQNGVIQGWPNCGSIPEIQTSLGVGIPAGRINTASVNQSTGVISITIANIDSTVDGSTMTLTPSINASDSSISWKWGGTIPTQYLPKQ